MKLQKILSRLQKLHPKEIDLSLNRVKNLCKKLGNPQEKLKCISIVGTNGKYSTCLLYTSPSPRDVEESRMPSSA